MIAPDILSVTILVMFSVMTMAYDFRFRRVPYWIPLYVGLACVAGWIQGMLPWSWFGVVIGLGIAILSRLGGGDVKVALTLGGLVGPLVMSSVFIFALGLSVTLLIGQRRGWHQWNVQRWPLVPFLVVPACAMVLLGVR